MEFIDQIERANWIKGELRKRGQDLTSLARNLGLPYGSVTGNVNGYRANPDTRQAIALYLGVTTEALFGDNGASDHDV